MESDNERGKREKEPRSSSGEYNTTPGETRSASSESSTTSGATRSESGGRRSASADQGGSLGIGRQSLSGLTELEAKEFHKIFILSFLMFVIIALIAHILVWQWRPWLLTPTDGQASIDALKTAASAIKTAFV